VAEGITNCYVIFVGDILQQVICSNTSKLEGVILKKNVYSKLQTSNFKSARRFPPYHKP